MSEGIKVDTRLQSDLDWKITSVNIYTLDGFPVFSSNYASSITNLDSGVVMQFYETVQSFAENNLNTRLVDFKVKGERVFFRVSNDHLYIITVLLGPKVSSGLSSNVYVQISSFISEVSTLLFFNTPENPLEPEFDFSKGVAEMVNDINKNIDLESEVVPMTDLSISFVVITDENGIPLISRVYESDSYNNDPILMVMYLHALNVFFNTHFSDALEEINFGNSRLYIKNMDDHFFALSIYFDGFPNIREDSPIHTTSLDLIDQMKDLIFSDLGEIWDDLDYSSFELMIDNFVFKAKFQLNS